MSDHIPAYRHHKPSGQAVVSFKVASRKYRHYYLGTYDSPESHERYRRLIAEWLATGAAPRDASSAASATVAEVLAAYLPHAERELSYIKLNQLTHALAVVRSLYDSLPATEFVGSKLRTVRDRMVSEKGWSRGYVNAQVDRVRRAFRWAVSEQLVPQSVLDSLTAVEGLRKGRTTAAEPRRIGPVDLDRVDAVIAVVSPPIEGLIRFQLATGCRPGEAVLLRPCDLDRSSDVWTYRPRRHKTEHHGHDRVIFVGPHGQDVLRPFLLRPPELPCFSPREAMAWWLQNYPGSAHERLQITATDEYSESSYSRAVRRACVRAKVAHWSPNQLRHTAATIIRERYGLEATQAVLGHSHLKTSEIYAERLNEKARQAIREVG